MTRRLGPLASLQPDCHLTTWGFADQGQRSGLLILFGVLFFFLIESVVHRLSSSTHSNQGTREALAVPPTAQGADQNPSPPLPPASQHDTARRRQQRPASPPPIPNSVLRVPASNHKAIGNLLVKLRQRWPSWLLLPAGTHPMAYLNLLADGVHNLTDGIALSSAFLSGGHAAGWRRTLIVMIHELPQEIGDFGVLVSSGLTPRQALAWNLASAGTAVMGAAGVTLVDACMHSSPEATALDRGWLSGLEAITAGGFLWIAIGDVLPVLAGKPHLLRNAGCTLAGIVFCILAEKMAH